MKTALLPPAILNLVEELARLPGIGRKTASRLAFYILNASNHDAENLARAIREVKQKIRFCKTCFNITEEEICQICRDTSRNRSQICVVEDPASIIMLEKTNEYQGLYHVLGGVISPLDGIGAEDLHMKQLIERLEGVHEVILALNSSTEGEATSIYLTRLLKSRGIKVTRLARGIPLGSNLEFVDELTLSKALKSRMDV
ncbi:MAG: recombination protein RecR [Calditrichaeota bacterium]|nr:recombination protein RecR [Calditrichota bacterium]RQV99649.1 MAG: recombination protein RecR [Calditrichota bacterium]